MAENILSLDAFVYIPVYFLSGSKVVALAGCEEARAVISAPKMFETGSRQIEILG